MLKIAALTFCMLIAFPVYASDFWIEALGTFNSYSSSEMQTELPEDTGIKLRAGYKYIYGWLSYDEAYWRVHTQGQVDLKNLAYGVGLRFPIVPYLSVYGEFGRFTVDMNNGPYSWDGHFGTHEGVVYKMRSATSSDKTPCFSSSSIFVENTFGGQLGIIGSYPIMPHVSIVGDIGYRWWRPTAKYNAYFYDYTPGSDMRYQADESLNLDSWMVGVGLRIDF